MAAENPKRTSKLIGDRILVPRSWISYEVLFLIILGDLALTYIVARGLGLL